MLGFELEFELEFEWELLLDCHLALHLVLLKLFYFIHVAPDRIFSVIKIQIAHMYTRAVADGYVRADIHNLPVGKPVGAVLD